MCKNGTNETGFRLVPRAVRSAGGIAAVVLMLSLCAVCTAQQEGRSPQLLTDTERPVIRVSAQFVVLDALVKDKKTGIAVGGLDAKDFWIKEEGVPQKITYISRDKLPLSIVFLFDLTETVEPVLKPLAERAGEMLGHLKPQDEVSVMVFSSHTAVLQGFTRDRAAAAAAIVKAAGMKTKEGTFIDEDMYEAVGKAMASTVPESRRVLVWLTDGTANFENSVTQMTFGKEAPMRLHSAVEARTRLLRSGEVVAALLETSEKTDEAISAGNGIPFSFLAGTRVGDIRRYAEMTGGPVLDTGGKGAASARLAALIDELRERYTLGYTPSNTEAAGRFCRLQLGLNPEVYSEHPELRKRSVTVRTRSGYYR